jgi:hypothetical protein
MRQRGTAGADQRPESLDGDSSDSQLNFRESVLERFMRLSMSITQVGPKVGRGTI